MAGDATTARRSEVLAVNAAGIVQGLALVTFPAAAAIFTSPRDYGLSTTAYGGMFLPQAVMAVAASLLGAGLIRRLGAKRIYLLGLVADLLSMALLFSSRFVMTHRPVAYGMLLLATTSLGLGFGLTVPALNTFTAAFFPRSIDSAVLMLNALLGVGTALAPVLVAVFIRLGIWWGLPLLVAALVFALLLASLRLPLQAGIADGAAQRPGATAGLPSRFWIFAAFALVYGMLETMSGNWAAIYMSRSLGASALAASLALTAFWGMVTAGRLLFAGIERWLPEHRVYRLLPLVMAAAFGVLAWLPRGDSIPGILAFGLAGLGCSALLPLTISFGQGELTAIAASVAGGLIAFYQLGYGLTAFGIGPLQEHAGLGLNMVFGLAAAAALVLTALSFVISRQGAAALGRQPHGA